MKHITPSISVVVASHNEGKFLQECLKSIKDFTNEIIVFDMDSSDSTAAVAKKYRAKIIPHKRVAYIELLRNKMVEAARGPWVLVLDPDEQLSSALSTALREIVKEDRWDAVTIPRKNIFFGRWIAHTNWWPDKHVRFFKKGSVVWSNDIHVYPSVSGRILTLPNNPDVALVHYGYETLTEFITRQNRYSEIEAETRFKKGERWSMWNFWWRPQREFLVRYIRHVGFLDGVYGLTLTILMMIYHMSVQVKLWGLENRERGGENQTFPLVKK